jgi:hypothetical protein
VAVIVTPAYEGGPPVKAEGVGTLFPLHENNILFSTPNQLVLTSGSDLNKTADGPWPSLLNAAYRILLGFRPNGYRGQTSVRIGANYGGDGSEVGWYYRDPEYSGVGNYPGPVPFSKRPTYNVVTPIAYGLRLLDPAQQANPAGLINIPVGQNKSAVFVPPGNASLSETVI